MSVDVVNHCSVKYTKDTKFGGEDLLKLKNAINTFLIRQNIILYYA